MHSKTRMIGSAPDVPLSFPYFSLIKERLYRVTQDAQSKEISTQLLVPKSRREMLFPWYSHGRPLGEAKSVAEALFRIISRVGIPKEILTDQGTAFMSRTLSELYELLGIKSIRTSVYHPQTDGLVERFNRTLKSMVRKFVKEDAKNWDKWLEPLLFAVREVPQASTGFSPFELLYGRQPRGCLTSLRSRGRRDLQTAVKEFFLMCINQTVNIDSRCMHYMFSHLQLDKHSLCDDLLWLGSDRGKETQMVRGSRGHLPPFSVITINR